MKRLEATHFIGIWRSSFALHVDPIRTIFLMPYHTDAVTKCGYDNVAIWKIKYKEVAHV